jgi:hypothetical protein
VGSTPTGSTEVYHGTVQISTDQFLGILNAPDPLPVKDTQEKYRRRRWVGEDIGNGNEQGVLPLGRIGK